MRSEAFFRAAETLLKMSKTEGLSDGYAAFDKDLINHGWTAGPDELSGGMYLYVKVPHAFANDDDLSWLRRCRANLAAAIAHDIETLPGMVETSRELDREEGRDPKEPFYQGWQDSLEGHLGLSTSAYMRVPTP